MLGIIDAVDPSASVVKVKQRARERRSRAARYVQLILSCAVLGVGVSLLLKGEMGSDGYSSLLSGLTLRTGLPFWLISVVVGGLLLAIAWARGRRPGPGTLVQWIFVGTVISVALDVVPDVDSLPLRVLFLLGAFVLMPLGVAGYLATNTGAGPAEGMALALDPPIPFRWGYSILQAVGALAGWLMGASVGVGTILVFVVIGPAVDFIRSRWSWLEFEVAETGFHAPAH